jgi:hypothetical protein
MGPMELNIEDLTIKQIREISRLAGCRVRSKKKPAGPDLPFKPGDAIIIRTVTLIDLGRVVAIGNDFITLTDGGWVASTGRFSETLKTGKLDEFERCELPWFLVGRGAICDVFPWPYDIPKVTL